jgi:O-methyltransferase domain/Dimerisation domain
MVQPNGPEQLPPPALVMQMITGHWVSQLVGSLCRLGIPDALAEQPLTSAVIAKKCGSNPDATYRILRAATGLGLLKEIPPGTFQLTPLGDVLKSNTPGSLRDFSIAETDYGHWTAWGHLFDAVKTGERAAPKALGKELFEWYEEHPQDAAVFGGAMTNLAAMVAGEVVSVCDFSKAKKIVDIGGSHGTLLAAVLKKNLGTSGIVIDLPNVADRARQALQANGLGGRAEAIGGDFFVDVPEGDVYLLKQILHDWNDDQCRTILANCARRLAGGGRIYIVEMIIPDDNSPSFASLMDLNMMVMLPGRERALKEYKVLLDASGLKFERALPTHSPFQIIEASKK